MERRLSHSYTNRRYNAPAPVCPTNQTFTVTPADFELRSAVAAGDDEEREYNVESVGDVDAVVLGLAASGDVTVEAGIVSFEEDGTTGTAELDGTGTLVSVEVDGVAFGGFDFGDEIDVSDVDEFSFTISHDANAIASVIPAVYVGSGDDDDELAIDGDGLPEDAFGIGGETFFVDPEIMAADDTVSLVDDSVDVTVQVLDEAAGDDLEVAGLSLQVIVSEADVADFTAVGAGQIITSATVTTDASGEATFSLTADDDVEDGDSRFVYFRWVGSGALAGLTAVGAAAEDGRTEVTFFDEIGDAAAATLEASSQFNGVGSQVTLTATVTDANGFLIEGEEVEFEVDPTVRAGGAAFTVTRTTNADGEATFTYSSSVADIDEVSVESTEFAAATATLDGADSIGWFVEADDDVNFEATDATSEQILHADSDAQIVFLGDDTIDAATTGSLVWVGYADADLYSVDLAAVTLTGFENALFDADGDFGLVSGAAKFESEGRDDDAVDTQYNLNTDSTSVNSLFDPWV